MKQYVVDELRSGDHSTIKAYLDEKLGVSAVEGLYNLPTDAEMLTDVQRAHTRSRPFYFAIDLDPDRMAREFFIRTDNTMRCTCMGYASERQRNWLIQFTDIMLDQLGIAP